MFEVKSSKRIYHANQVDILDKQVYASYPYVVRMTSNNGIKGYLIKDEAYANEENTLSFAQDTFSVFYQKQKYFTGNNVKILKANFSQSRNIMQYITACFQKSLSRLSWGVGSTIESIYNTKIQLPIKNGEIDFAFMEFFISELEAEQMKKVDVYLIATGLKNYVLTKEEITILEKFESINWGEFNLLNIFGKSTRGKRLKSADRISGNLPFVTAGETEEGISAYISNEVDIFSKNTTTIDMFGSAKYRNYEYGADDHVAVVHTEKLSKFAAIFITTAIHKSSYTGKFNYSRNFYAKDADELSIFLPTKDNQPDYKTMETLISAIQKLIIKDLVLYTENKVKTVKK